MAGSSLNSALECNRFMLEQFFLWRRDIIRMSANLQNHHPYNLSSLIHLTLQQCFCTYMVLLSLPRFLHLYTRPNSCLHNIQFGWQSKWSVRRPVPLEHKGQCRVFDIVIQCMYEPVVLLHVTNICLPMVFYWINSRGEWNGYETNIPVFCWRSRWALIFQPTLHKFSSNRRSHKLRAMLSLFTDCCRIL